MGSRQSKGGVGHSAEPMVPQDHVGEGVPIFDLGHSTLHYTAEKDSKKPGLQEGYYIRPATTVVCHVAEGNPAEKAAAFRYVNQVGNVKNENSFMYVIKVAAGSSKTTGHSGAIATNGNNKAEETLCIFCSNIPETAYVSTRCEHIGCRVCWLSWCKESGLKNIICPQCGVPSKMRDIQMLSTADRKQEEPNAQNDYKEDPNSDSDVTESDFEDE
ncbi:hypothetical protein AAMO2058_001302100 [Amorphochlora amoebiformis]